MPHRFFAFPQAQFCTLITCDMRRIRERLCPLLSSLEYLKIKKNAKIFARLIDHMVNFFMKKIDTLRKRLLYQSQHRGMKEMDLVLGGFAGQFIQTMREEELLQFEDLLAFPDQDLYSWFFEGAEIPDAVPRKLIEMITLTLDINWGFEEC